jgi:phosphonate transport system permease protein
MSHARQSATPVIRLDDVRLTYDDGDEPVVALDGVSLRIDRGERVAIIGPSGSGKTSLVKVLGGMQSADSGSVLVNGRDLQDDSSSRDGERDVGHIFQEFGLISEVSALRNVCCGRLHDYDPYRTLFRFDREDRRDAAALLSRLGLGDRIHEKTSRLSGGEKQRVGVARLLAQSPELVLMDEPVSNLDIHWAGEVMRQLDELRGGDATVVAVLHDLAMVRRWADRVLVMHDCAIIFDGAPEPACRRLEQLEAPVASPQRSESPEGGDSAATEATPPGSDALDRPVLGRRLFYGGILALLAGGWIWSAYGMDVTPDRIFGGLDSTVSFLSRLVPPDLSVTPTIFESLVETIQMAFIGTTLAAFLSLPISVLAARNVSPLGIRAIARILLVILRTIPSIIWGLFFVAMVGLGPLPGVLALTFYAAGYLGKFYYEGIESISTEPVRHLQTMGASRLQQFRHGVYPQVLPLLVGYTLYMFEYNVRAASILGIVGAGGIGFYLYTYVNNFQYTKATTALIFLVCVVLMIDFASSQLRRILQE